jgi:HSP20 family protein
MDVNLYGALYCVRAALPGMEMKDITVQVENNMLTISGERKEEKKENTHRTEWFYGSFCRSFALPPTVHGDQAKAAYDKGVLIVTLPKREETKPKKVKIEVH